MDSFSTINIKHHRKIVILMVAFPLAVMALVGGVLFVNNTRNNGANAATAITLYPPQPGLVMYGGDVPSSYARAGAMVDVNSAETTGAKAVSNAGGTVLVYVDTIADGSGGNYARMINEQNSCGPAIGRWPGANRFNDYGYVRDLKTLVNSGKLKCILETVVRDNPHMGGFFADDLGTTNPQYSGSIATQMGGCSKPTDEFYNAAINTLKVFRQVADAHGIMVMVNGGYQGGACNGGYPTRSQHGTSLAEGSCIEHHSKDAFFAAYTSSSQWADASPITKGQAAHFVITGSGDNSWNSDTNTAWITRQPSYTGSYPAPWSGFHPTSLPNSVGGAVTPVPTTDPTPTTPTTTLAKPVAPSGLKLTQGNGTLTASWTASPSTEKVDSYQVYLNGATAYSSTTAPSYIITGTPGTSYSVRVSAHNVSGYGPWSDAVTGTVGSSTTTTPTPTTGTPTPTGSTCSNTAFSTLFPKIESEAASCSSGTTVVSDTNASNSSAIKMNANGQYNEYVFKVPDGQGGQYAPQARIKGDAGSSFRLRLSNQAGTTVYSYGDASPTSSYAVQSLNEISLTAGQIVKIRVVSLNSTPMFVDFLQLAKKSAQSPFGGILRSIPGTIQAEDFDEGGEGVAYHDLDTTNKGGKYRSTGVDIENASTGSYDVGWNEIGEWREYTVNAVTGTYDISAKVSSALSGGQLKVVLNGRVLGTIYVPNSGGWQSYRTVTISNIAITGGGSQVLRLETAGNSYTFDSITFTKK